MPRRQLHPERQGSRPGDEIQSQQRAARRFGLQHIGHEEKKQRRWQCGGDAVGDKDQQQTAKSLVGKDPAQAGQQGLARHRRRRPGRHAVETDRRGKQQKRRQQPAQAGDTLVHAGSQHGRQGGRKHHAEQPEALARRRQTGAQPGIAADIRPPGLVGDRCRRKAEIGQRQGPEQPDRRALSRRIEQGDEAQAERQQGQRQHAPARHPVRQPAQPRIDPGIEQARPEQDQAEQRQRHARHLGIKARHMHVDR